MRIYLFLLAFDTQRVISQISSIGAELQSFQDKFVLLGELLLVPGDLLHALHKQFVLDILNKTPQCFALAEVIVVEFVGDLEEFLAVQEIDRFGPAKRIKAEANKGCCVMIDCSSKAALDLG